MEKKEKNEKEEKEEKLQKEEERRRRRQMRGKVQGLGYAYLGHALVTVASAPPAPPNATPPCRSTGASAFSGGVGAWTLHKWHRHLKLICKRWRHNPLQRRQHHDRRL